MRKLLKNRAISDVVVTLFILLAGVIIALLVVRANRGVSDVTTSQVNHEVQQHGIFLKPAAPEESPPPLKMANYRVYHFTMNLDGSTYRLRDSEGFSAERGSTVTPEVKDYEGFTAPEKYSITVASDGASTVEYRYTRNKYKLSLKALINGETVVDDFKDYATADFTVRGSNHTGISKYSANQFYGEQYKITDVVLKPGLELDDMALPVIGNVGAAETTAFVKLKAIEYPITYDLKGGTLASENPATYNCLTPSFTLNKPTKQGYSFTGWTGSCGTTPVSLVTISKGSIGEKNYVANYGPNTDTPYKVEHYKMDTDGANYTLFATDNLKGTTDSTVAPAVRSLPGFISPTTQSVVIKGDGSTVVQYKYDRMQYPLRLRAYVDSTVKTSLVGYATVDIYVNDVRVAANVSSYSTGHYYGAEYRVENVKPAAGRIFLGENTSYPMSGTIGQAGATVGLRFDNVDYSITYNLDGGAIYASAPTTYDIDTATFPLPTPTKTGYHFLGWSGTGFDGIRTTVNIPKGSTGDRTYTANWAPKTVEVTYHKNDGTGATANAVYTYDVTGQKLTNNGWTRTGYNLLGWARSSTATARDWGATTGVVNSWIDSNSPYLDLYAVWQLKTAKVTFNKNDGSGTTVQKTYTYGTTGQKFSNNSWTRPGYTLLGWSTSDSATSATYSVTSGVTDNWISNNPTVTLYAVWRDDYPNLTLVPKGSHTITLKKDSNASSTVADAVLTFKSDGGHNETTTTFHPTTAIDLTYYNKMTIVYNNIQWDASDTSTKRTKLGVTASTPTASNSNIAAGYKFVPEGSGTLVLDISGYTGNYYPIIMGCTYKGTITSWTITK